MTEIAGRMRAMARQAKSAATVLRALGSGTKNAVLADQIGRASCRERV